MDVVSFRNLYTVKALIITRVLISQQRVYIFTILSYCLACIMVLMT